MGSSPPNAFVIGWSGMYSSIGRSKSASRRIFDGRRPFANGPKNDIARAAESARNPAAPMIARKAVSFLFILILPRPHVGPRRVYVSRLAGV